jgi:murein L,D-transpeptidase YcbB/YkuD
MRAEAPIELGKLMLNQDCVGSKYNKVSGDSLQSLIDQQRHQKIPLLKAIPIFVEYHTVTADQKGLYFHLDLYQKERALIALFRSGNNG